MTPQEANRSKEIMAKMAAPLDAGERHVCVLMGISEEDYRETRNSKLKEQLPACHEGVEYGLTTEEARVATLMHISFADYAETKIAEAQARQKRLGG